MTFKPLLLACLLSVASAVTAAAATYRLGDVTDGITATHSLRVQTVDFLEFSLDAPRGSKVSALTISVTSTKGSNFSEMIALYSDGALLSAASAVRGGGNTATLTFSGATALADGVYTLGVAGWKAFFTPGIADARSTAFFRNGNYTVQIDSTISAVPLPAGVLLLISGVGAIALTRRKARTA
jgi:hypothetical protein